MTSPGFWKSVEDRSRDVTVIRCSGEPSRCPVHGPEGIETRLIAMGWRSAFSGAALTAATCEHRP